MPGPPVRLLPNPVTDAMTASPSVFDSPLDKALRMIGGILGVDDPMSQVLGIAAGVEAPGAVAGPLQQAVGRIRQKIRAFHGSPHDFDRFSMEKIGTGEGAQAYGHGLYFAENEKVAQEYKRVLEGQYKAGDRPLVRASEIHDDPAAMNAVQDLWQFVEFAKQGDTQNAALVARRLDAAKPGSAEMHKVLESWQAVKGVDPAAIGPAPGRMYEVEIDASPDELLDWDAPLSQQPPKVQETLRKLGARRGIGWDVQVDGTSHPFARPSEARQFALRQRGEGRSATVRRPDVLGEDVYRGIGDKETAAAMLRERGVKGIRYRDAGSRNAVTTERWYVKSDSGMVRDFSSEAEARAAMPRIPGATLIPPTEPSRNFVVFDDSLVEIIRKYGIAVATAAGYTAEQIRAAQAAQGAQQ